jgi:hypothetical protein
LKSILSYIHTNHAFGVSLRDRIRNEVIRQRTTVTDIVHRISMLKWQWAGHISSRTDNSWGKRVLESNPRLGKRSVAWPEGNTWSEGVQASWSDDLRGKAGRKAEDRARWGAIGEAYVQQ